MATACEALGIEKLSDQDFDFLTEFAEVVRPIADAITFVEGMRSFGSYLPTLFGARMKLREIYLEEKLIFCQPLVVAIKEGFDKRFGDVTKLTDLFEKGSPKAIPLYLAMISNPDFKLSYIPDYWIENYPNTLTQIKSILLNALRKEMEFAMGELHVNDENDNAACGADTETQQTATVNQSGNFELTLFVFICILFLQNTQITQCI